MSIKPSVVYIKGVHSITGHDQSSDIGFPQLELEKLFEGATIKEYNNSYNNQKKLVYKTLANTYPAIEDEGHFNCLKNGYISIAENIGHYYTIDSNGNYIYHTVPNTETWANKYNFSNTIQNENLYSVTTNETRIYKNNNFYKKDANNNFIKQERTEYKLFDLGIIIDWENDRYRRTTSFAKDSEGNFIKDENGKLIGINIWKKTDNTIATSGQYLCFDTVTDNNITTYQIKILNLAFDDAGSTIDIAFDAIYNIGSLNLNRAWYIKEGNFLKNLPSDGSLVLFNNDPTATNTLYYDLNSTWVYPNSIDFSSTLCADSDLKWYINNEQNFPLYYDYTETLINKTSHAQYSIYEKTAIKINYNYSGDANSLKFIFTDKDIDGVLEACNLSNDIKKYIHLTNLKYNDK